MPCFLGLYTNLGRCWFSVFVLFYCSWNCQVKLVVACCKSPALVGPYDFYRFFMILGHRVSNLIIPRIYSWVNPLNTDKDIKIPTSLSVYFFYNFIWKRKTIIFISEREDAFKGRLRKSNCNHKFGAFVIQYLLS